ncbi:MAG: peptidase, partial [Firmicutes bacterium]|nr:peptidase [Bacillota bacterium]
MILLELLAPAGSYEALTAAVQNGAGAVYLGYGNLNARRNAKNFTKEELAAAVSYCHLRGVRVYLTLNTLITDRELPEAYETAAFAARCGVDAVLVQDLGLLTLLRRSMPELPLHASTQMTIHNLPGVNFCRDLGLTRVVLSRELSRRALECLCRTSPLELEVFLHGALCMCYSGQCYFSALLGGRSGNRGLCAQPCRLPYRREGELTPSYPLSLKDLSLSGQLKTLADMGIACLKLEGRMKRPEYVAIV